MKFGEAYREYLQLEREQDRSLAKSSHVEYKRLKKVLKTCRRSAGPGSLVGEKQQYHGPSHRHPCHNSSESCPLCDGMFFSELEKQAFEISRYLSSRVRRLVDRRFPSKLQKHIRSLQLCLKNDMEDMVQKGRFLFEYVAMNATAMRKILKKYDKVHGSVNGRNFKSILQSQHVELLQSPWLMELTAFWLNSRRLNDRISAIQSNMFFCDMSDTRSVLELTLSNSVKLEYNLNCAICMEALFNPYALGCGHVFCKTCLCSAASVMLFQGVHAASHKSKCPICRDNGVYATATRMAELNLLVKNRCKKYWKERLRMEQAKKAKQSKDFWDQQTKYFVYGL